MSTPITFEIQYSTSEPLLGEMQMLGIDSYAKWSKQIRKGKLTAQEAEPFFLETAQTVAHFCVSERREKEPLTFEMSLPKKVEIKDSIIMILKPLNGYWASEESKIAFPLKARDLNSCKSISITDREVIVLTNKYATTMTVEKQHLSFIATLNQKVRKWGEEIPPNAVPPFQNTEVPLTPTRPAKRIKVFGGEELAKGTDLFPNLKA